MLFPRGLMCVSEQGCTGATSTNVAFIQFEKPHVAFKLYWCTQNFAEKKSSNVNTYYVVLWTLIKKICVSREQSFHFLLLNMH